MTREYRKSEGQSDPARAFGDKDMKARRQRVQEYSERFCELLKHYPKRVYCISNTDETVKKVLTCVGANTLILQALIYFTSENTDQLLAFSEQTQAEAFLTRNKAIYNPEKESLRVVALETLHLPLGALKSMRLDEGDEEERRAIEYVNALDSPLRSLCIEKIKKYTLVKRILALVSALILTPLMLPVVFQEVVQAVGENRVVHWLLFGGMTWLMYMGIHF